MEQPLHTADLLLFKTVNNLCRGKCQYKPMTNMHGKHTISTQSTPELNALGELLRKSAVEHLQIFLQSAAPEFQFIAIIVTTGFVALYAYKRGDYRYCLDLSTQNVHKLLKSNTVTALSTFPEFIQLLDDDIVSLTALILIINPDCRTVRTPEYTSIDQLILSLYLMIQCQLKLRHSLTQLLQTLEYIEDVRKGCHVGLHMTFNHLILKLSKCKVLSYLDTIL